MLILKVFKSNSQELLVTKSANNIQQAAIIAANPITNPMKSQILAPPGPNLPFVSPLMTAFETELTLLNKMNH